MNETWLAHHGILGQKWGIRRFQNKDGSYTAEGKNRYGSKRSATIALDPVAFVMDICRKDESKQTTKVPIIPGKLFVSSVIFMPFNAAKNAIKGKESDEQKSSNKKVHKSEDVKKDIDEAIASNKEAYDRIKAGNETLTELANKVSDEWKEGYKKCKLDEAAKSRILKKLEEDFGSGCDDKDLWDMVLEDYVDDEIRTNVSKSIKTDTFEKFENATTAYWKDVHSIADPIKQKYANTKISTKPGKTEDADSALNDLLYGKDGLDTGWNAYLWRHFDDYWINDLEEHYDAINRNVAGFSMEDYNKKHSGS